MKITSINSAAGYTKSCKEQGLPEQETLLSVVSRSIIPIPGNYTFLPIHHVNITGVNLSRKKETPKREMKQINKQIRYSLIKTYLQMFS